MARKYKMYLYSEQCAMQSRIVASSRVEEYTREDGSVSDDIWLWGEGTEEELIAQARETIATQTRGPSYQWKCAKNVLDYFGAPVTAEEVESDA